QIIHCRVNNREVPVLGALQKLDSGHQNTGVGSNGAARLENQLQVAIAHSFRNRFHVFSGLWWLLLIVGHTQTTSHVEMTDLDALLSQSITQSQLTIMRV